MLPDSYKELSRPSSARSFLDSRLVKSQCGMAESY